MQGDALLCCGVCWEKRRGSVKTFEEMGDLSRHVSQVHPGLGYLPVKLLKAST